MNLESPFALGWWSFDLGDYRPCDGTYELYPYESIPPLDESQFRGDFQWLAEAAGEADPVNEATLHHIEALLRQDGLALPPGFARFMGDQALQDAVPSCTACEWDLSEAPVPSPVERGAFTVRFLRDQQDCLFWYLYLAPGRKPMVVCSPIPFDDPSSEVTVEEIRGNTWTAAPSFESFVYRWWIENELWELVNDDPEDDDLTPAQAAYLRHYRNRR